LTLRLTGSEKPAKLIAEGNGLEPDEPLPARRTIRIDSNNVRKNRGDLTVLKEYNSARAKLLHYDFDDARDSDDNIQMPGEDPAVIFETALCDYLSGNFDGAIRLLDIQGDSSSSAVLSAFCASANGDLPAAEDKLLSRLLNEPGDRRSKYLLGEVMRRQKRYPEARSAYFGLLLDNENGIVAELTRTAVERATREEMKDVKERIENE